MPLLRRALLSQPGVWLLPCHPCRLWGPHPAWREGPELGREAGSGHCAVPSRSPAPAPVGCHREASGPTSLGDSRAAAPQLQDKTEHSSEPSTQGPPCCWSASQNCRRPQGCGTHSFAGARPRRPPQTLAAGSSLVWQTLGPLGPLGAMTLGFTLSLHRQHGPALLLQVKWGWLCNNPSSVSGSQKS